MSNLINIRRDNIAIRGVLLIFLLAIIVFLGCGCSVETESGETTTIIDSLGREVEVPVEVETIVATGDSPRLVSYMGLADKIVGTSGMDWDSVTPMTVYAYVNKDLWEDLPLVGSDAFGNRVYYPEMMIEANPDVIFTTWPEDIADDIEEKTGIPVVCLETGALFGEEYDECFRIIGEVTGTEDRAEEIIAYIDGIIEDWNNRTKDITDSEKPSVISAAATYNGAKGIDGIRPNDPVLTALNANNLAADESYGTDLGVQVDKEQILEWNPDYIFCDYEGISIVTSDMEENPSYYAELDAFESGNAYQHPSSTSYYANLEIPLANGYFIGKTLYPDEFEDIDVDEKLNEIVSFMLGVDNYQEVLEEYGGYYGVIE